MYWLAKVVFYALYFSFALAMRIYGRPTRP